MSLTEPCTLFTCYRCGREGHTVVKSVVCHNCGKTGHLQSVCKNEVKSSKKNIMVKMKLKSVCRVGGEEEGEEEESEVEELKHLSSKGSTKTHLILVKVKVDYSGAS